MRTIAMAATEVARITAEKGGIKPVSLTYAADTLKPGWLRYNVTFANGVLNSWQVPNEDIEYVKEMGRIIGSTSGATASQTGASVNNVLDKLIPKGTVVAEQVRTIGIFPVLLIVGISAFVLRLVWKAIKKRKRRR